MPAREGPATEPTGFTGFGPDVVDFYSGLELDNSKTYWDRRKDVYTAQIKEPMAALLASIEAEVGTFKVFRPHRDVRFSKDKSPYKTEHGAIHGTAGGTDRYVHVSADGLLVAAGMYVLEPDQVRRWREAVADDRTGPALVRAVHAAEKAGLRVEPGLYPPLKTSPRGFPADHPRIDWLRWKGCIAMTEIPAADLQDADVREQVLDGFARAASLTRWLEKHVGPAEPAEVDSYRAD